MPEDVNKNPKEDIEIPQELVNEEKNGGSSEDEYPKESSRIYKALSRIFFIFLLFSLGIAIFLTVLTLDFLDIAHFRYKIPEEWRSKWPLAPYYDFVQLHQLPEEERYQQLIIKQQQRFEREIVEGNKDLQKRAKELEESYIALMRTQKERYNNSMQELRRQQEELLLEQKKLEEEKEKFQQKKVAVDQLANKLASEAANLESSLIKFMEEGQRLEHVRRIATVMEAAPLASIFNEVADNKLIYDILSGLPPAHAARVLGLMDVEKAGQIMKFGQLPMTLPEPGGPARTYIPPSLANLVASTQAVLND